MTLLSGPNIAGNEWKYIKDCLDTGWVSSVGGYVTKFEQMVADFAGCKFGVATTNGTSAIHIALELSGVKRNDLVIVPNITFIASCNAIKYTGADPILMDIDAETWQMDLDLMEDFLRTKTIRHNNELLSKGNGRRISAIMPVHVLGNMCDMERLMALANEFQLKVIEDSTEALGSYFNGKHAGSFGEFGTFSFNGNKIITTGGGGIIVTNDEKLAKKAKHITTQAKSDPMEYIHDEIGYNYRLVNVLAAMGVAQMELLPAFIERKKEIDAFYKAELAAISPEIKFQKIMPGVEPNRWLFTYRSDRMQETLVALNEVGLQSRPFWRPMNRLRMFENDLYYNHEDNSGKIYGECLSIPCSTNITDEEMKQVVEKIAEVFEPVAA